MGAWSFDPFGNDDAGDWLSECEKASDFSAIETALSAVIDNGEEYLEAPECSAAIAAAGIVAALMGKPIASLPKEPVTWVEGQSRPSAALVARAAKAVSAILDASELQELWAESEHFAEWQDLTRNLLVRLGSRDSP